MDLSHLSPTDWIGLIGGITGLIGGITGIATAIVTYRAYRRDRADVKLSFRKGWKVMNAPGYDPDATYSSLKVSNKGRRPVTITKGFYQLLKYDGGAILADSMRRGSTELTEGKSVEFLMKEEPDDNEYEISYYGASDAIENVYKLYVAPIHKRLFYNCLHLLKIRKKKPISSVKKKKTA